jgi:DNA-binding transcriptional ArsR family regulator
MRRAFRRTGRGVAVRLSPAEVEILGMLPGMLLSVESEEPAAARLDVVAHPTDPAAEAAYRELTDGMLEEARSRDRSEFAVTLGNDLLTPSEADAWLRVIGEARLVLAARLGIEEDGWERHDADDEAFEMSLLRLLEALQEDLVAALLE